MKKKNKLAVNFFSLAHKALVPHKSSGIVFDSTYNEEVSFHRLHLRFMEMCRERNTKSSNRQCNLLEERYPFVKINGRWKVSSTKLYLYLIACRSLIASFEDEIMQKVHDAIQNAQKYYDEYKDVENKLQPHCHEDYAQWMEMETRAYENYMMKQKSIFGERVS